MKLFTGKEKDHIFWLDTMGLYETRYIIYLNRVLKPETLEGIDRKIIFLRNVWK